MMLLLSLHPKSGVSWDVQLLLSRENCSCAPDTHPSGMRVGLISEALV